MAPSKSTLKSSSTRPNGALFAANKDDKRRIKHANLMNKVAKSAAKAPRRRRPHKKLVTTLDALADALPDQERKATSSAAAGVSPESQVNVIKRKSIKSRPGAMKRREKIDKSERDRFARNMAQMTSSTITHQSLQNTAPSSSSFAEKMAALRGFISQTLERRVDIEAPTG